MQKWLHDEANLQFFSPNKQNHKKILNNIMHILQNFFTEKYENFLRNLKKKIKVFVWNSL